MNAIVMDTTRSIGLWFINLRNKLNRSINRVGYARAASELARLGYHKEAREIMLRKEEL